MVVKEHESGKNLWDMANSQASDLGKNFLQGLNSVHLKLIQQTLGENVFCAGDGRGLKMQRPAPAPGGALATGRRQCIGCTLRGVTYGDSPEFQISNAAQWGVLNCEYMYRKGLRKI